jgi:hypothetical protein
MREIEYCTADVDGIKVFYRQAGPYVEGPCDERDTPQNRSGFFLMP